VSSLGTHVVTAGALVPITRSWTKEPSNPPPLAMASALSACGREPKARASSSGGEVRQPGTYRYHPSTKVVRPGDGTDVRGVCSWLPPVPTAFWPPRRSIHDQR